MIQVICDACGKKAKHPKRFSGPCHLLEFAGKVGFVDSEGPTSGRNSEYDVCSPCWNRIYGAAAKVFFEIQKTPTQEER
jgi:hypothetical protein